MNEEVPEVLNHENFFVMTYHGSGMKLRKKFDPNFLHILYFFLSF